MYPALLQAQSLQPFMGQITDGRGTWYTLHTKHFRLHYREGNGAFARRMGRIAERVHADLEPRYKSGANKTDVVLILSNGPSVSFAFPWGLDQIVLNMEHPPAGEAAAYTLHAELLFRHEYVHVLSLRQWGRHQPINAFLRLVLGFPPNIWAPLGLIEGTATFEESSSGQGRVDDPLTRMEIRTAVLEDSYPTLGEVLMGTHRWPYGLVVYLYGGRLMQRLADLRGRQSVSGYWSQEALLPILLDARLKPWKITVRELYEGMKQKDYEEFSRENKELRARGLTPFARLTRDGGFKSFLYFNDRDEFGYFASPPGERPGLYRLKSGDRPELQRKIFTALGFAEAAGLKIYSEDYFEFPIYGLRYELYDGARGFPLRRLAPGRYISFPALARDGKRIYFIERDDNKRYYLKTAELGPQGEFRNEKTLLSPPAGLRISYTTLAPDDSAAVSLVGGSLLVSCGPGDAGKPKPDDAKDKSGDAKDKPDDAKDKPDDAKDKPGDVKAGGKRRIPNVPAPFQCEILAGGPGVKAQPSFSRDGRHVLFASAPDGIYNIYDVNVKTGEYRRRTRALTGIFYPAPGPDGLRALAFYKHGYDVVRFRYTDLLSEPVDYFTRDVKQLPNDKSPGDTRPDDKSPDGKRAGDKRIVGADWEERPYGGPFALVPYFSGFFLGPGGISFDPLIMNAGIVARDPMNRHNFWAGVGNNFGTRRPMAWANYDYTRFATGLALSYNTNHWTKLERPSVCYIKRPDLSGLCQDTEFYLEEMRAHVRYLSQGRHLSAQALAGYAHRQLRNAHLLSGVYFNARDLNLNGPSVALLVGDTSAFAQSISPEKGWRLTLQSEFYTRDASWALPVPVNSTAAGEKERVPLEYGTVQGGLALYLPSFFQYHVNYLNAYGFTTYGRNRDMQFVSLSNYVRGLTIYKAPINHSAAVFTYEYRFPLLWLSQELFRNWPELIVRSVGVNLFYDYGASFDREVFRENWIGSYGLRLLFGLNLAYIPLPVFSFTVARGTRRAGEFQYYFSFSTAGILSGSGSSPIQSPHHPWLPAPTVLPGYFRERAAGGILE